MQRPPLAAFTTTFHAFLLTARFAERYPFYAAILAGLRVMEDPSVERMAVSLHSGSVYLHVNADAMASEPQFVVGVLLHEIHHLALGHLGNPTYADLDDQELAELALEMSANEFIEEPLPSPITWQQYATFGMRAGQSTIERYTRLLRAKREGNARHGSGGPRARGANVPTPPPLDDHRYLRTTSVDDPHAAVRVAAALLAQALASSESAAKPRDDRETMPAVPLIAGTSPGRLLEALGAAPTTNERADWQNRLRMFVAVTRTPQITWSRPNRRFANQVGIVPGRRYRDQRILRPRVLVVLDTSGSMTRTELAQVATELREIATHTELILAECDTEITRCGAFDGDLNVVCGRGGTDLRPALAASFLLPLRLQGIVYFTDGCGPTPDAPPALPLLWVLTKDAPFACPWGTRTSLRAPLTPTPTDGRTTLKSKTVRKPRRLFK
jgi:predicted metal-dependent peptidase